MCCEYRIVISGRVQGVFFRSKTKQYADQMGLKGTARNLSNGDVEICLFGTEEKANCLVQAMKAEPPPIQVTSVQMTRCNHSRTYSNFSIIHNK